MHIQNSLPLLVGHILDHCVPCIACVIDNNIYRAKAIERALNNLLRKCRIGHIASDHNRLAACVSNRGGSLLSWCRVQITHHHRSPFRREEFGGGGSNAATRASQNSNFAIKHTHEKESPYCRFGSAATKVPLTFTSPF